MNKIINADTIIPESLKKLQNYIEKEAYKGYDPYDALKSPFFKLPVLKNNKLIRFGTQQLVKRFPLNLRPVLFIKKGLNPVTLGLAIQAYTALGKAGQLSLTEVTAKCNPLINELVNLIPSGYHGSCWGYDFDWESRYAKIPAYQPTIVATGFITNALFKLYKLTGNQAAIDLCTSACQFIYKDINHFEAPDGSVCFSYSPFDQIQVFNASMKGVRLLSQVYSVNKDQNLALLAKKGAAFVASHQQKDGSWKYAALNKGEWIDNYHTGYVLDCFDEYQRCCNDNSYDQQIKNGYDYYLNSFFENGEIPKFFNNSTYPIDCTSAGQSILTLIRFGNIQTADKVAIYTIQKMQHSSGYFYFRKYQHFTEKHSFMRWSNAWMFAALAELQAAKLQHK